MCSTFKGVRFEHNDHKSNSTLNGSETLLDRLTQSDASVTQHRSQTALYLPCFSGLIRNACK